MPITTKNDDILISFSYEYPMEDKSLKLDLSLFYKEEILNLKIKNGNRLVGVFPVTMFQEVLDFLQSKGYTGAGCDQEDATKSSDASAGNGGVDELLRSMSSSLPVDATKSGHSVSTTDADRNRPVQSFSTNCSSPKVSSVTLDEKKNVSDDIVSFQRTRDDINYVESGFTPENKEGQPVVSKDSTIKRS